MAAQMLNESMTPSQALHIFYSRLPHQIKSLKLCILKYGLQSPLYKDDPFYQERNIQLGLHLMTTSSNLVNLCPTNRFSEYLEQVFDCSA